jgi:hypothetical protein
MRFIVFILLYLPVLSIAQNKIEEVQLKSGKIAVLYDSGEWFCKVEPEAPKPVLAGNHKIMPTLGILTTTNGRQMGYVNVGDTVTVLRKYNSDSWLVNYRGKEGLVKDLYLNYPKQSTSPARSTPTSYRSSPNSQASYPCGARTKTTGAPCRRLVKGGGYCYQHT